MQWGLLCLCFTLTFSASRAGVIDGALQCPEGGTGTFVQMQLTSHNVGEDDCTAGPCQLMTEVQDASYGVSLTFTAGEPASELFFEIWFLRADSGVTPLVREDIDSVLTEGQDYEFGRDFVIPARFGVDGPHYGELSILITNRATRSRIICGAFPISVIEDEILSK